jgi:hypothetical protein
MSNTPRTDEVKSRLNGEDSKALNEELRLALIDVNRLLSRIEDLKHEGLWGRPDRF